jgi:hypothetical protein
MVKTCWFFFVDYNGNMLCETKEMGDLDRLDTIFLPYYVSNLKTFSVLDPIYGVLSTKSNLFTNTQLPLNRKK